ncbi:MAG TPA: glutaredoxin family protein [Rubrivivax sp.]|jgi:glutaredoxin|nr:glutaredoxin family protein [Rubrivivax sp.]
MNKSLAAALVLMSCGAAWAQYKVIRPDGSVTYTDRPPIDATNVRITPLGRGAQTPAAAAEPGLPIELRQVAQRYPVTLYASADCVPCDNGRKLLQQRGVPFSERRIASNEDALALERLAGGRTVPSLTIGAQQLRGYSEADWAAYLDAAGYPRESRLPRNWPTPAATPLVERAPPPRTAGPVPAARNEEPQIPVLPSAGVRF